ncbi:hypothetical protein [Cerasicoccus frondis]|uniref:hypothetical protein n=1 Tax=Cerasicoccus frondis TaxID=490090 RepID=UPI00285296AC|nr:hypothetical protein [Cerasicoccus frondis]
MRYVIQCFNGQFLFQDRNSPTAETGWTTTRNLLTDRSAQATDFKSQANADRALRDLLRTSRIPKATVVELTDEGYWPISD